MDEKGKSLQAQLQFMERNGRALEELIAKMLRVREEQESFLAGFARSLQDMGAQEDSREIAQCLTSLGECGGKLATETHDVMLQRPESEMLLTLTQIQDWGVVPMKVRVCYSRAMLAHCLMKGSVCSDCWKTARKRSRSKPSCRRSTMRR